ncbi:MAG TPA: MATE family efflux transporter [Gammaproteobacteria bacterium]|nr:MATE family efflux transporter [Gammaproteobacteria bacterium]
MIWGIFAMMSFNVIDTWFCAQLGAPELAAMSFTFPVVMVIISLGIGLMAGTSSVIARAIGRGDEQRVRRLTTDALAFSLLISLALSAIGIVTLEPLFRLLGASEDLLPLISDYMLVWYVGLVAVIPPMAGMGAIRATGDSRFQSRLLIVASFVNLILDPLLIFGLLGFPRLELQGAAVATIAARTTTIAAGFWALHYKHRMMSFDRPMLSEVLRSWGSVLHVGMPAAGTNVIIPASTAVVVAMIAGFGHEAVAGFGAASRIEALSLVVFFAMSSVIGPFVGQNLGAGKRNRIDEANRRCAVFCLLFGLSVAAVLAVFARPLIALFSDDARVLEVGAAYLWIVPVSYGAAGIVMVVNAAFNGLGRPFPAVAVSTLRMVVLYLPLAWVGARLYEVEGIFAAAGVSNLLAGIAAYFWLKRTARNASLEDAKTGDRGVDDSA